ncbi:MULTISPECIES: hypothetical protein [Paraburkholderia]|uniref:hypothetical protein n=1 Tax=Paraburkholderia TaxID=1822464 RepID=UPI00225457ED|nr:MULTISPECIES: hypothetical protein [Paraburkholderia]MCX4162336.1 hypothetical protein [Paraburkholderia megapolitana]MDN7157831.1 hypothetical protein [Paraburkholderia sp. CHISQ3]MDQ6494878.1 hypothetical protein [Paraburkholderia megapolitana]
MPKSLLMPLFVRLTFDPNIVNNRSTSFQSTFGDAGSLTISHKILQSFEFNGIWFLHGVIK